MFGTVAQIVCLEFTTVMRAYLRVRKLRVEDPKWPMGQFVYVCACVSFGPFGASFVCFFRI